MGGEISSESIGGYGLHWRYTGVEPTDQQPMPHTSSLAHQSIMHPSLGHVVMISTACYSNGIRIVFQDKYISRQLNQYDGYYKITWQSMVYPHMNGDVLYSPLVEGHPRSYADRYVSTRSRYHHCLYQACCYTLGLHDKWGLCQQLLRLYSF